MRSLFCLLVLCLGGCYIVLKHNAKDLIANELNVTPDLVNRWKHQILLYQEKNTKKVLEVK